MKYDKIYCNAVALNLCVGRSDAKTLSIFIYSFIHLRIKLIVIKFISKKLKNMLMKKKRN